MENMANSNRKGGGTVIKVLCYKLEGRWFDHSACGQRRVRLYIYRVQRVSGESLFQCSRLGKACVSLHSEGISVAPENNG
jgi:hypothetical protein